MEIISLSETHLQDHPSSTIYPYELVLAIDSSIKIYTSDEISLRTSGLLGDRNIVISPKPAIGVELTLIPDGGFVYSSPTASMEDTVSSFSALSSKAEIILDQLNEILEASGDDIDGAVIALKDSLKRFNTSLTSAEDMQLFQTIKDGVQALGTAMNKLDENQFFDHISDVFGNLAQTTQALNDDGGLTKAIDSISCLCDSVSRISDHFEDIWPSLEQGINDFSEAIGHVRGFTTDLKNRQGNLGKFLNDDGLYLQARGILTKVETLMDDVNHYGVLFHLNRSWQRQRTRRANRLAELCTAQQFRNYFQEELTQIDTSFGRVSMLLDKVDCDPLIASPLNDQQFSSAFSELLRRVQGVEERLQEYNSNLDRDGECVCIEE